MVRHGRSTLTRYAKRGQLKAAQATAGARMLPDFLIIGAQKAGTTSLYAYLAQHPDVRPALVKEAHYFDHNFDRGLSWYRSRFPLQARMHAHGPDGQPGRRVVTGEATPYYLFHPLAAERAAAAVPDAKLIVLLRDPVQRAWSHYRHEVKWGNETLSFEDAVAAEPERLRGAREAIVFGGPDELKRNHQSYSYVARGRYAEQLMPWLKLYPAENVLALRAEDLFERPAQVWDRTLSFLSLAPMQRNDFRVHNRGNEVEMPERVADQLRATFEGPNAALTLLLGSEFSWSGVSTSAG